jgi:hypothetical protein
MPIPTQPVPTYFPVVVVPTAPPPPIYTTDSPHDDYNSTEIVKPTPELQFLQYLLQWAHLLGYNNNFILIF